jgi:large conductance mechanosensitive channel
MNMGMVDEFKGFILKGNALDLAVGAMIGAGFGKVVAGVTDNVIMPIVGVLMPGDAPWREFGISLGKQIKGADGKMVDAKIGLGPLLGVALDFVILGFILFAIIKAANKAMPKKVEAPAGPPAQEVLLTEIRDLLKKA